MAILGWNLKKEILEITDDDLTNRLQEIRKMLPPLKRFRRQRSSKGTSLLLIFEGSLNGKPLKEMKADNYHLEIGSGNFVPGFEDQLIGMKKGETKEIKCYFPSDYQLSINCG